VQVPALPKIAPGFSPFNRGFGLDRAECGVGGISGFSAVSRTDQRARSDGQTRKFRLAGRHFCDHGATVVVERMSRRPWHAAFDIPSPSDRVAVKKLGHALRTTIANGFQGRVQAFGCHWDIVLFAAPADGASPRAARFSGSIDQAPTAAAKRGSRRRVRAAARYAGGLRYRARRACLPATTAIRPPALQQRNPESFLDAGPDQMSPRGIVSQPGARVLPETRLFPGAALFWEFSMSLCRAVSCHESAVLSRGACARGFAKMRVGIVCLRPSDHGRRQAAGPFVGPTGSFS